MRIKRITFLLIVVFAGILGSNAQRENTYFIHKVERGETLYSISKQYDIPVDDIYKLNPTAKTSLLSGSFLKIPQISGSYFFHDIRAGETLYSLAKKYGMTGEDIVEANPGLSVSTFKIGKTIRIPTNRVTHAMKGDETADKARTDALLTIPEKIEKLKTIRMTLLLPLGTDHLASGKLPQNKYTEFYEGLLIAVRENKAAGVDVSVEAYNTGEGTLPLKEILKRESVKNTDMIIGGVNDGQIEIISTFSKEHSIPYVIPTVRSDASLSNSLVFLINTPPSYLFSKASSVFCSKFRYDNIVFANSGKEDDKQGLIKQLSSDLRRRKIAFHELSIRSNFEPELKSKLSKSKGNVIVPTDDSEGTLKRLIASLESIQKHSPGTSLSLYGYPVWQIYALDRSEIFHKMSISYYTFFYSNKNLPRLKAFESKYERTYHKHLLDIYPRYGVLGYDLASYFIKAAQLYGKHFYKSSKLNTIPTRGIQTDFHFERENNWSGFINTNMYMITYNLNNTIIKKRF